MHLNHLNLPVHDLDDACAFFAGCFDFRLVERRADAIAVMVDSGEFVLVLSHARAFTGGVPEYPPGFHVGFNVGTAREVDDQYRRLVAAGVAVDRPPANVRGRYSIYFTALRSILFEVSGPLPAPV